MNSRMARIRDHLVWFVVTAMLFGVTLAAAVAILIPTTGPASDIRFEDVYFGLRGQGPNSTR